MHVLMLLIALLFSSFSMAELEGLKQRPIRFCAGTHEWPPYYFFGRKNGEKTASIEGLDIDIFNEVFTKNGIAYSAQLLPWKRCLSEGMKGEKFDVVFGGGLNDQRRADYVTTKGYYTVVPSYFYKKSRFPSGVEPENPSDLKTYGKLCGVVGFNYANFGQKNENVERASRDYQRLVSKTLAERCDISLVRYEILSGWGTLLDKNFTGNENLVFKPVPNNPEESFHLMISKNYQYSSELKEFFESQTDQLKKLGKLKLLLDKYK